MRNKKQWRGALPGLLGDGDVIFLLGDDDVIGFRDDVLLTLLPGSRDDILSTGKRSHIVKVTIYNVMYYKQILYKLYTFTHACM